MHYGYRCFHHMSDRKLLPTCRLSSHFPYSILSAKEFQILLSIARGNEPWLFQCPVSLSPVSLDFLEIKVRSCMACSSWSFIALPRGKTLPDASWLSFPSVWWGYLAFTQQCNIVDWCSSVMHNKLASFAIKLLTTWSTLLHLHS